MAFESMASLRQKQPTATVVVERSLLDAVLETTAEVQAVRKSSLLDSLELAEPATVEVPVVIEERWVEVQLLDWTMVLIPCVGCGCYPCKPHHLNGHTEIWVPTPGDVCKVRI